jgi:hypothetical protein
MAKAAAQKKAATVKPNAEKIAKELAEKKAREAAAAWEQFHGEAHFIQNNYCIQLNGKMTGNEEVYKSLYTKITDISPRAPLEEDDCSDIGYTRKVFTSNMTVEGVDASIWLQPTETNECIGEQC